MPDQIACPMCGCEVLKLLGTMGPLIYLRCCACGADTSIRKDDDTEEDES